MGTIPAVPTFPAGYAAQGAQLAELCAAITWLMSGKPLAQLAQNVAQSLTNATAAAVSWDTKVTDRDSGWSSSHDTRYTAQTPGYYLAAASVSIGTSSGAQIAFFQVTTGSNNPAGSGVTTKFGRAAIPASGACVVVKSLTPYLYDLDYVEVWAEQTSGSTVTTAPQSQFTVTLASG
jgi:hypothetical protein